MSAKKTLILGASNNPQRYSYLALNKLKAYGHDIVAVGKKESVVNGIEITRSTPAADGVDTITLYLNPGNQVPYYDYILSLRPKRIIFNPGTENPELVSLAKKAGISTVEGCTLVMLSTNQY
jgi:uncharacterized protein